MNRWYILLLLFIGLAFWGCEDEDQVPEEVSPPGPVTLSLDPSSNVLEWTMNDDDEILVHLDGDDWFAIPNVLEELNKFYIKKSKLARNSGKSLLL